MKAGSYGGAAHRHGDGNERYAGKEDPAAFGNDAGSAVEDGPWDDAGPFYGAVLYQGCPRTRAGGTWDNQAGDQVYVLGT